MQQEQVRVYVDKALTAGLTVVAVLYALGQRAVAYYVANQTEINEDLRVFWSAVVEGTKRAYSATYQLGGDARVLYEENKGPVGEKLDTVRTYATDGYTQAVAWVQDRIG